MNNPNTPRETSALQALSSKDLFRVLGGKDEPKKDNSTPKKTYNFNNLGVGGGSGNILPSDLGGPIGPNLTVVIIH